MIDNFALIIGAMKCGTTSLFSYLSQHPQIAPCKVKEPNFFTLYYDKGFDYYLDYWDWNPSQHKFALEATVNYTKVPILPNAAENIYKYRDKANFKFIYIIRNPLERIESHYTHVQGTDWGTVVKLSEGIDDKLIEFTKYAQQIEEYYKRFPADSILLLDFEELKNSPLELVKKVCRFLEIDYNYEFQRIGEIYNPNKNRIINDRFWRRMRRIKPLRTLVKKWLPTQQKQIVHSFFGNKVEEKFRLSPEQKDLVLSLLREDLRKLKFEYGIDVSRWGIEV